MSKKPKYRTFATAKYNFFKPDQSTLDKLEQTKALSVDAFKDVGKQILPQEDLLYVRSVLVTTGANANDDVFFPEEMWKARTSPILKPLNWMHKENDIIGVMFNVQAKDLGGEVLDFAANSYDDEFEIVTEGVVYKLLFPDKAREVEEKCESGELFVSMECWFNDYDYVIYDAEGNYDIVKRQPDTVFLDSCLRVYGGTGSFKDPTTGAEKLVKRGLRDIIYGGCGFVYRPANLRSVIEETTSQNPYQLPDETDEDMDVKIKNLIDTLQGIVKNDKICANKEVDKMDEKVKPENLKEDIAAALNERDMKAKAEKEIEDLKEKASLVAGLQEQVNELNSKIKTVNDEKTAMISSYTDKMKEIVKVVSESAVDIPAYEEKKEMADQLDWLYNTIAKLVDISKDNKSMANKLRDLAIKEREDQIKLLLGDYIDEDTMEKFSNVAKSLDEEAYEAWMEDKKVFADLLKAAKKAEDVEEDKSNASEDHVADELENVQTDDNPNLANVNTEVEEDAEDKGMDEAVAGICEIDNEDNDS